MKTLLVALSFLLSSACLYAQRIEFKIDQDSAHYSVFFSPEAYKYISLMSDGLLVFENKNSKNLGLHKITFCMRSGVFLLDKDDNFKDVSLFFSDGQGSKVDSVVVSTKEHEIFPWLTNMELIFAAYNSDRTVDIITVSQGVLTDLQRKKF